MPAATVCAGAGVWAWLVPHVAGSLGSQAGFSNVDAWLAAMVLPVLGAVTAYHHRIASARRPAGVGWVFSNGIVASLLLHPAPAQQPLQRVPACDHPLVHQPPNSPELRAV